MKFCYVSVISSKTTMLCFYQLMNLLFWPQINCLLGYVIVLDFENAHKLVSKCLMSPSLHPWWLSLHPWWLSFKYIVCCHLRMELGTVCYSVRNICNVVFTSLATLCMLKAGFCAKERGIPTYIITPEEVRSKLIFFGLRFVSHGFWKRRKEFLKFKSCFWTSFG